jgi:hypothetical protein
LRSGEERDFFYWKKSTFDLGTFDLVLFGPSNFKIIYFLPYNSQNQTYLAMRQFW